MTKANFIIRTGEGFVGVEGYITADGLHGIDKRDNAWHLTDIPTGIALSGTSYKTRKSAIEDISRAESVITARGCRDNEKYAKAVAELNKFKGVDKESEVKKMAKTNTKAKADTTAPKRTNYKKQNEELKREIERLKKQIEGLTKVEKTNIDSFDVEAYMASRDNTNRITEALVEALKNTEGLVVTLKGSDNWLYVSGKTADGTKSRKDIFKTMGFRWSGKENAWFLAPYPLANGKRWAAKKASKASANA